MSVQSALRLGAPSWVYPDDVLPNAHKLAGLVQDIEWLVFEVTYGLPGPEVAQELARLATAYCHSYTVHLPLDLHLAAEDEATRLASVETARRVIAATRPVAPWAYVVHVQGEGGGPEWGPWHERAAESLRALGKEVGKLDLLAVENLPDYAPEQLDPLLERLPVSFCFDLGHCLRQGSDPLPVLQEHIAHTRAIHLHGLAEGKDHRELATLDQGLLLALLRLLRRQPYRGVVTIECFGEQPFFDSWDLAEALWRRTQDEGQAEKAGT